MRILHISDTHGGMPPLKGEYDVIVHSGDLLPNRSFANALIEEPYQTQWLSDNAHRLAAWLGSTPVLLVPGNHDYVEAWGFLRAHGIHAWRLEGAPTVVSGVTFYGFPWTPSFGGWNWMCSEQEIELRLGASFEEVDVFVSHGPMYGVLDRNRHGERCGSKSLRKALSGAVRPPQWLLHGHIHEAAGVCGGPNGIRVSNAATTQRIIEVTPR